MVGAGPSGLFAALELARHGVRARVVEREPKPHRQARATAFQPATLEILAAAGVLDSVLASSVHLHGARMYDAELHQVGELSFEGVGCRWEFQCSLPQWRTEEILEERLVKLGGEVERGITVNSLGVRENGVDVSLKRADGATETVEAEWVVGAGGAHSITRRSMGESLIGESYRGTSLVADVQVNCGLPRDAAAFIAGVEGFVMIAPLPGDRWITFVGDLDADEVDRFESGASVSAVERVIQRRASAAVHVDDVDWAATFRMHRRLVTQLAGGRRFLLGDAGHLSSPFGGEGMNSGTHDAQNLAWKLALHLHGRGRPELVDSFASERFAADRHVLQVADRLHEAVYAAIESARTGIPRPARSPDEAAELARARAMLDMSYAGSPIVGEYRGEGDAGATRPHPGEQYPDRAALTATGHHLLLFGDVDEPALARLDRRWRGLVDVSRATGDPARAGSSSDGAVLVRPDGYIGFRSIPADAKGLEALDTHLDTHLVPS